MGVPEASARENPAPGGAGQGGAVRSVAVAAGPDQAVAALVLALDQGGVDRSREARVVELDRAVGAALVRGLLPAAPNSVLCGAPHNAERFLLSGAAHGADAFGPMFGAAPVSKKRIGLDRAPELVMGIVWRSPSIGTAASWCGGSTQMLDPMARGGARMRWRSSDRARDAVFENSEAGSDGEDPSRQKRVVAHCRRCLAGQSLRVATEAGS